MRIKAIYIENIQSIKKIRIDLDEKITRLQGRNTCGKSAIAKSISIFSGTYTRNQIKALLRKDKPANKNGMVSIQLEDNTILTAIIGNKGDVDYIHQDINGNILNKWNKFNEDILKILQWTSIEDESLCLNVKDSSTHLFINTKPKVNGVLVDYLCRNQEIELKIAKLEEKSQEIKEMRTNVLALLQEIDKKYRSYPNVDRNSLKLVTERLLYARQKLMTYKILVKLVDISKMRIKNEELSSFSNKLVKLAFVELLQRKYGIIKELNRLKDIKYRLIISKMCDDNIKISQLRGINLKNKEILYQIYRLNQQNVVDKYNKSTLEQLKLMKSSKCNKKLMDIIIKWVYINKIKVLNENMGMKHALENSQYPEIKNKLLVLNYLRHKNSLINVKWRMSSSINIKNILTNSRLLGQYNSLYSQKWHINVKMVELSRLKCILNLYNWLNEVDGVIKGINDNKILLEKMYHILEKNNICPLCGNEIDLDKYKCSIGG